MADLARHNPAELEASLSSVLLLTLDTNTQNFYPHRLFSPTELLFMQIYTGRVCVCVCVCGCVCVHIVGAGVSFGPIR